ncbi:MAG: hypothetical protein LPK58_07065 [Gammaproteobacteria bacterium]|mgnify:CR=1 FL=1|nr:hypothetical protein [Gammaproteobacteria bacterium]MDX5503022.1 hypothetical protein [Halomonas sp.]
MSKGLTRLSRLLLPLVLAGLAIPLHAAETDDQLATLLSGFAAIPTLETGFREERHSELLIGPLIQQGQLRYRAPDFLERRTQHPTPGIWRMEGGLLVVENGDQLRVQPMDEVPEAGALADALLGLLNGEAERLARSWQPRMQGQAADRWMLELAPATDAARRLGTMQLTGTGTAVMQITTFEPDGSVRKLYLDAP